MKDGFDPVTEIPWLGKSRICQIHVKDNPHYLGEGTIEFAPIMHAIRDIGFMGFANLETDADQEMLEADFAPQSDLHPRCDSEGLKRY